MRTHLLQSLLGLIALSLASSASAASIESISASPSKIAPGGIVQISVTKQGSSDCGARILIRRGTERNSVLIAPFGFGSNPKVYTETLTQSGSYTLTAEPIKQRGLKQCDGGSKSTTVVVTGGGGGPTNRRAARSRGELKSIPVPMTAARQGPGTQDLFGILGVDVKAYGTSADFMIRLTDGAMATITATPQEAVPNPSLNPSVSVTARVKGRNIALAGLSPATTYSYRVVTSRGGPEVSWEGTFRTRRRVVKFVVKEIHAIDDGDDAGAGDFSFSFYRGDQGAGSNEVHFRHGISTGTMVETDHSVTFPSVRENTLRVGATISEHDGPRLIAVESEFGYDEKRFSFDWVRDRQSGGQQKDWSWAVSRSTWKTVNPWHLLIKGQLRVSWAD